MTSPARIVVSGSSSGIGRALVERLVARGHEVHGLARRDQTDLRDRLGNAFQSSRCDVACVEELEAALAAIGQRWHGIDAIVTCAGDQGAIGRAMEIEPRAWTQTVRANLDGTFLTLRLLWPLLAHARRRAKVVCFSGGGATKARAHFSAYGVAKTGVVRLVETIAEEERERALDINAIAPGAIFTAMTEEVLRLGREAAGDAEHEAALRQQRAGRAPLERALDLVEWLLGPASDGISGRLLSAPWDPWPTLDSHRDEIAASDLFTLRRIAPADRGREWA